MKKQPERTERTRQAIMDAFWELYLTKKIEKISVREVAAGAGIYRSTFYEYFMDVYDVLDTIERRLLEDFQAASAKALGSGTLDEMAENMLSFYESNGERISHLLGPNGDPEFSARAMKLIKESLLSRLGLPFDDLKADLLFGLVSSSIITLLNYWYAHRDSLTLREVSRTGWSLLDKGFVVCIRDMVGTSGIAFLDNTGPAGAEMPGEESSHSNVNIL